jgi:uncharacterized protein (DUF924 family)
MGVDTDTNSLPVQTSAVDKVVEATQTQMTFVFCYIFLMHQKNLRPVNDSHQLLNL